MQISLELMAKKSNVPLGMYIDNTLYIQELGSHIFLLFCQATPFISKKCA